MIIATCSQAGTIRDHNQDVILVDAKLRLAIITDGNGPQGKAAAELAAKAIWARINEIAPVTSGPESEHRLQEAIELAAQSCAAELSMTSVAEPAAIWVNRGVVAGVASGHCAIATDIDEWKMLMSRSFSFPVQAGKNYLLCSEGITAIYRKAEKLPVNYKLGNRSESSESNEQAQLEAFAQQAAATYDGDDRSAILIRLDKSDITAGEPHEIELFENYNKEYNFPLWAPLAAAVGIAASSLFAAFKLKKYLPRINLNGR